MQLSTNERELRVIDGETLSSAVAQVNTNGYVVFENALEASKVQRLYAEFKSLYDAYVRSNSDAVKFGNCRMDLPLEQPFIDPDVITNPFATPIIDSILGDDCTCHYFASNTSVPSSEYQGVHSDLGPLFPGHEVTLPPMALVVNIPLVDFTMENGPLEIWPGGTHRIPEIDNHPDYIRTTAGEIEPKQVTMPAGSVLIRDIRMWHRGTPNRTQVPRPMIALVYFRPWFYSNPLLRIQRSTYNSMSDRAKKLFRQEDIVD